jgi:hypothetical protein
MAQLKRTANALEELSTVGPMSTDEELTGALNDLESILTELREVGEKEAEAVVLLGTAYRLRRKLKKCPQLAREGNNTKKSVTL